MLNPFGNRRELMIGMSIGIGLGLFLLLSFSYVGFLLMPIASAGLMAFILGILWFIIERKKIGFSLRASIFTIVLMPFATIPLYILYFYSLGFILQAVFDGLALLFVGSGFFAIGLVGVYAQKSPKNLGIFFMILSLIFFLGIPLVNEYKVLATRWGTWIATPYEGYTIPLILVGVAFFLLGCGLFFYKKSLDEKNRLIESNQIKQEKTTQDLTHKTNMIELVSKKFGISEGNFGFICLIFSSLSLILAAVFYAPNGPSPLVWGIGQTPSRELTIAFIILSVALFFLGSLFVLYGKSKGLSFLLGIFGSLFLFGAGFAHGFRIDVRELVFGYVPVINSIRPFRNYTLMLFLSSFPFLIMSYILLLRATKKN